MTKKLLILLTSYFMGICVWAQSSDLIYVKLDSWAKNEQFDKLQIIMPFYVVQNDSIETLDFENMRDSKKLGIVKPQGYISYAYGYLYFRGINNPQNDGFVSVLMVDLAERIPKLFIDRNNNYNFTDDGDGINIPMPFNFKESVTIALTRQDNVQAAIAIKLSRMDYNNKYAYKNLLNEYYSIYDYDRKFTGIEYCFREQRYIARQGIVRILDDSFKIALQDDNSNGLYNDIAIDKIITANYADTIFDSKDEMRTQTISSKKENWQIEKNGKVFEIVHIDEAGQYLTLREIIETQNGQRLTIGKKAPNFTYTNWQGNKHRLKKLKKQNVYIYYTGPYAKNFIADTSTLRLIAEEFKDCVKVIGFIDVNKSYELKIFGTYSDLNWVAAFKNKYISQQLNIRGIPSSLWLGKNRKVKQYNLTPQQFLQALRAINKQ